MTDQGLLVLDNKEQANLTQELIDHLLFLATGAERARSSVDGKNRTHNARPLCIVTSIEGAYRQELNRRCVEVGYALPAGPKSQAAIDKEIKEHRHEICSALMKVLSRYFAIRDNAPATPNPLPYFQEQFRTMCILLMAFGDVAGKPLGWADQMISDWKSELSAPEDPGDMIELCIMRIVRSYKLPSSHEGVSHAGKVGTLYVTTASDLLDLAQEYPEYRVILPKNPRAFSRRLTDLKSERLAILKSDDHPQLARRKEKRPIGIFVFDDE
jgi:hypothetical protein